MLTTNDDQLAKRAMILREHGMSKTAIDRENKGTWYYDVVDLGYNYRLNELQALLGISQLKRIGQGIKRRIKAAHYYNEKFRQHGFKGIIPPYEAHNRSHVFHLYVIRVEKESGITRNTLFERMTDSGIGLSVHYTPLHLFSFYRRFLDLKSKAFPVAERIYREILSLPLFPTLTKRNIDFITAKMKDAIESRSTGYMSS